MEKDMIQDLARSFEDKTAEDVLRYFFSPDGSHALKTGERRIALASSMGAEDQVLTHMILKIHPRARIFILDTGRLHSETYDLIHRTMKRYGIHYEIFFPETADIELMESRYGPDLFYESIKSRKKCCFFRKVKPLQRMLSTLDAWITGLRKAQAVTRGALGKIEWDDANGLVKINPLADWSEEQVWNYIKENGIPYNALHDQGFPSIGCAPCTRPIQPGEEIRAGRWWWETPEQKECGLHIVGGKAVRKGNEDG